MGEDPQAMYPPWLAHKIALGVFDTADDCKHCNIWNIANFGQHPCQYTLRHAIAWIVPCTNAGNDNI